MGTYLNPGNSGFEEIVKSDYVDKTGLVGLINRTIGTKKKLTCISWPRRFGKSYAAQTLCAYYDKTCDSRELFAGYSIAEDTSYEKHLNQYDVIYLDMTNLLGKAAPKEIIEFIGNRITNEIREVYPEVRADGALDEILIKTVAYTGNKFVMIIDEWDALIRETPEIENDYLKFLRMLFKSSGTTSQIFAAAYMTGILPIKKEGSQSAVSDFEEYSILDPGMFAGYVGFTETEVARLCAEKNLSLKK